MSPRRGRPRRLSLDEVTKICKRCGDPYSKPANCTRVRWAARKYCSLPCAWAARPNWNRYAKRSA